MRPLLPLLEVCRVRYRLSRQDPQVGLDPVARVHDRKVIVVGVNDDVVGLEGRHIPKERHIAVARLVGTVAPPLARVGSLTEVFVLLGILLT